MSAQFLLRQLEDTARRNGVFLTGQPYSSYRNAIPVAQQGSYPGDLEMEERLTSIIRWSSLAMVVRANNADGVLGSHIANLSGRSASIPPDGQLYEPEDTGSMMFYKEAKDGPLLEEGITEAGAISSWAAAATSYSIHGAPTLPFYIYYSMFGFQRIGDLIWAAVDQRARGFLLGTTAGRTTLSGEGLQHQDGTSHLIASTIPNCRAYDPAYIGELAVILDHGMRRMMQDQADEFYYITVMNENYAQPSLLPGTEGDIIKVSTSWTAGARARCGSACWGRARSFSR